MGKIFLEHLNSETGVYPNPESKNGDYTDLCGYVGAFWHPNQDKYSVSSPGGITNNYASQKNVVPIQWVVRQWPGVSQRPKLSNFAGEFMLLDKYVNLVKEAVRQPRKTRMSFANIHIVMG